MLFLHREINNRFCYKTVNRIAGFILPGNSIPTAVGTKYHIEMQKKLVENLPVSCVPLSLILVHSILQ